MLIALWITCVIAFALVWADEKIKRRKLEELALRLAELDEYTRSELKERVEADEETQGRLNDMDASHIRLAVRVCEAEERIKFDRRELTKRINDREDEVRALVDIKCVGLAESINEINKRLGELEAVAGQSVSINSQLDAMLNYDPQKAIGVIK